MNTKRNLPALFLALALTCLTFTLTWSQAPVTNTYTTSGTYNVPVGITTLTVECWGAGGGGGGGSAGGGSISAGGGGGGGYTKSVITVAPGSAIPFTVGVGGPGGGQNINGTGGSNSIFQTVTAFGGQGGFSAQNSGTSGAGGGGNGTIVFTGGPGGNGNTATNGYGGGGGGSAGSTSNGQPGQNGGCCTTAIGGTPVFEGGIGGTGGSNSNSLPGLSGGFPGGGGGGGASGVAPSRNGGSGANGQVRVTYQPPSSLSTIVEDTGFPYPSGIPYQSFQHGGTNLTVGSPPPGDAIAVARFLIVDPVDADSYPTTLNFISFSVTNPGNLKSLSIQDNSTGLIVQSVAAASSVTFGGLTLTAPDGVPMPFTIYATFNSSVIDNTHFELQVSGLLAATGGSTFQFPDGGSGSGGARSSTNPTNNQVVVNANKLRFVQGPTNSLLGVTMAPSTSLEAVDASGSRDLDFVGVVNITSSGTLSTAPVASMGAGFGLVSPVTHSVAGTGLVLSTSNGFGLTNAVSTPFNITTSSSSDIIANPSFTYPTNIAYNNFQESIDITNSATSLVVAKFDLRDGGVVSDADAAPTILSSLSVNLGSNFGLLRRIALYDAAGSSEIGADVTVSSSTVSWSGLALSAADNGSTSFTLRASFKSSVTDNLQFSATVSAAGTQANTSSTFATANAGGAVSSVAGNNNRIEVTATKLVFSTNINANILGGVDINTQQTSPQLIAMDVFNNTDLDYSSPVSLTPSANVSVSTLSSDNAAPNAGVYTFPTSPTAFKFILTGPVTLTAAAGGLTSAVSNAVTVFPGAPNASSATTDVSFTPNWSPWGGTPAATGYLLDVSTVSNFSSFVGVYNGLNVGNVTSYSVNTGLTGNTLYYYRIRVVTGSGTSIFSPSNSVTTAPAAPAMSAFTGVSDVAFTVNWAASAAATKYFVDISTNAAFSSFVGSYNNLDVGNVTTLAVSSGLSANTTYYVRVRANNSNGTSGSSTSSILTAPLPPTPTFGGINNTAFNVNWTASPGATNYAIDVSTLSNFSVLLTGYNNQATGNVVTYTVSSGLSANTLYYVRLRATNGTSISGNGNGSVTTAPLPPAMQPPTLINATDFTANWSSSAGATSYLLDVSSDNFATTITGYSGLSVTGTSKIVSGLQSNTTYQYRARAVNGAAVSLNPASSGSALTLPSAPVSTPASGVNQNGFTINWNAMTGITNFRLDVSAVNNFSTRLTGFDNLLVTGTSKPIGSLTPGTTYYYRLRAENPGTSANSNVTSVITVPLEPVAIAATSITSTGFTANWNAAQGADSYQLDVSTASDFSSFITGYNGKPISITNEVIGSLNKGTVYYYRLRAANTSGASGNSNTISQVTIPDVPVLNTVTIKNSNTFIASWAPVPGADSYEIDVSTFASQFATFVSGFNAKSVAASPNPESLVTGLTQGTAYTFRVRSVNAGGKSASSVAKSMLTDPGSGQAAVFTVNVTSNNNGLFSGTGTTVQGTVANGVGVVSGTFSYKGITEATATKSKTFTTSNNAFSIPIDDSMLDELGIEYVITVVDETDASKSTAADRIFRSFSATTSPAILNSSFEGSKSSIRIISIPYDLKDNLIESIFSSLGAYDKTTWRLAHFQQSQGNVEFREGINKIERGLGYWFNAKGTVNIKSGDGSVGTYSQSKPFTLSLVTGWNQIGNPYPFAIDWSDVLADNKSVTGVGSLKVYNGAKANYDDGNKMDAFTGGFVHADKDATLSINVALRNTANGGRMNNTPESFDLGTDVWTLPLRVHQNNSTYDLGAVGMNTGASIEKDVYDEIRLPRLDEYLDITFDHPQSRFRYFTKDVIPTTEKASWSFKVSSNAPDENALLSWDNTRFGHSSAKIWLLDPVSAQLIDMTVKNEYTFNNPGEKEFRMFYSKDGSQAITDLTLVGPAYPNPTTASASFSLILPEGQDVHNVDISVLDMTGRQVRSVFSGHKTAGIHTIEWDGTGSQGTRAATGLYLIKTQVNEQFVSVQKILLK